MLGIPCEPSMIAVFIRKLLFWSPRSQNDMFNVYNRYRKLRCFFYFYCFRVKL